MLDWIIGVHDSFFSCGRDEETGNRDTFDVYGAETSDNMTSASRVRGQTNPETLEALLANSSSQAAELLQYLQYSFLSLWHRWNKPKMLIWMGLKDNTSTSPWFTITGQKCFVFFYLSLRPDLTRGMFVRTRLACCVWGLRRCLRFIHESEQVCCIWLQGNTWADITPGWGRWRL